MRRRALLPCFVLAAVLYGCHGGAGDDTGEVSIPEVRQAEESGNENSPAEEQQASVITGTEPGAVLGEEEVILMQEGETVPVAYSRIQGMEGFTIAYDPESFTMEASEQELCFYADSYGPDSETPVFVKISESEGASEESLAEK